MEIVENASKYRWARIAEFIPGTYAHARRLVDNKLLGPDMFDRSELTSQEKAVLEESRGKYIHALTNAYRSKYSGFLAGCMLATNLSLINIATIILSVVASGMTNAWYSITLKEMKEKFERMGLSLTTDLLTAEMKATSIASYSILGVMTMISISKFKIYHIINSYSNEKITLPLASAIIAYEIVRIVSLKEHASIKFDYNDATLGGMTETQHKFFVESVNKINKISGAMRMSITQQKPAPAITEHDAITKHDVPYIVKRDIVALMLASIELIFKFDANNHYKKVMIECEEQARKYADEYENLDEIHHVFADIMLKILNTFDDFTAKEDEKLLTKKQNVINVTQQILKREHISDVVAAQIIDVVNTINEMLEIKGEKIFKPLSNNDKKQLQEVA